MFLRSRLRQVETGPSHDRAEARAILGNELLCVSRSKFNYQPVLPYPLNVDVVCSVRLTPPSRVLRPLTDMLITGLAWGRPPPIALPFIDCELNSDTDQKRGVNGEIQHGCTSAIIPVSPNLLEQKSIHSVRHRLRTIGATILKEIRDIILGTKPTKYTDILALDRKLRECAVELFGGPVGCRKARIDV